MAVLMPALHIRDDWRPKGRRLQSSRRLSFGARQRLQFRTDVRQHLPLAPSDVPLFRWSYPWAVVAAGGTQICLRKVEPAQIFRLIAEHRVTHLCGAPIVLNMLAHAPADQRVPFEHKVTVATGGAAPPSAVFRSMEALGFRVTHLYGATETYGPATSCVFQPEWNALPDEERFARMARQGVAYPMVEAVTVADTKTMAPVPRDGTTVGEIMVRSNTVMKGYLKNEAATAKTLVGNWCLSGDLAVWHPDGAIEIKI